MKKTRARPGREKAGWGFGEGAAIAPGRTVVELLGGGPRYEVYLVWDEPLDALAVAKILRPDRVSDESAVAKLRREAELLERLAHPILAHGLDYVADGSFPHVLLEYLDGPNLRQVVKDVGPLAPDEVATVGEEVAGALEYLASEGLVHLDVKPSNIVLGVPTRLIDLGAARSLEHAARLRMPHGTDHYMAPELCEAGSGSRSIGSPADVWGLGATLYYAATGEVPFPRPVTARASDEPTVRFPQLIARPSPMPDYVPGPLEAVILHMLAAEPSDRPRAGEIADSLRPLRS